MLWPVTADWTLVRKWNYWFCPDRLKSNFLDWTAGICPFPWPLGDANPYDYCYSKHELSTNNISYKTVLTVPTGFV